MLLLVVGCCALGVHADTVTKPLRSFGLGDLHVTALSPDGKWMVTGGQAAAYLWDYEKGEVIHTLDAHRALVTAVAFSPDSKVLLTAGHDALMRAWDVETGLPLRTFSGHRGAIGRLAFSPDGSRFVSASEDNTAGIWSMATGELQQVFRVPGFFVQAAVFTGDGAGLVTLHGTFDNRVRLWDAQTGALIRAIPASQNQAAVMCLLPENRVAAAGADGQVRIWNLENGQFERTLADAGGTVQQLLYTTNRMVVAATSQGRVCAWDLASAEEKHAYNAEPLNALVWAAASNALLGAHVDNGVRVRSLDGTLLRSFEGHTTSTTLGVAFSPDRQHVLSGGVELYARLWNRTNAQPVRTYAGDAAGSPVVLFSPDGSQVLTTLGFPKKLGRLVNAETAATIAELEGHTGYLLCAAFSPDGRQVVTGGTDGTVRVWSTNGESVRVFYTPGSWVRAVTFSSDGKSVAAGGSDSTVHLWELDSGRKGEPLVLHAGSVKALAFAPNTGWLMAAWEDGVLRLFDPRSGDILFEFMAPSAFLNTAVFSPDGRYILIGEGWPTYVARLLDTETARVIRVFAGHTYAVESVAFDRTGTLVLTGADRVRLWSTADLVANLSTRVTRGELELNWPRGTLQRAAAPNGPWLDIPEAAAPWRADLHTGSGFFRLKVPAED